MSNLNPVDRMFLEKVFEMEGGYVLSFSNATFEDFVRGSTGEEIYSDTYSGNGDSKANRLRAFWNLAPDAKVGSLLDDLLTLMIDNEKIESDGPDATRLRRIVQDLRASTVAPAAPAPPRRASGQRPTAFISYSVEKKEAGGAVKTCLSRYGYECFLAHEDLRVSEEWKHRILEELGTADIFVALLSKEFKESAWCGQETGFIVSRADVLVVPLSLDGTMPYGFIDHLQGIRVTKGTLDHVLEDVLYRKRPRQMIPSQIEKVRAAGSFRRAEAEVGVLVPHFEQFSEHEVQAFAFAAAGNSEVWDAGLCATEHIPEFVRVNRERLSSDAAAALRGVLPDLDLPQAAAQQ